MSRKTKSLRFPTADAESNVDGLLSKAEKCRLLASTIAAFCHWCVHTAMRRMNGLRTTHGSGANQLAKRVGGIGNMKSKHDMHLQIRPSLPT
jgi:hypothetical protein